MTEEERIKDREYINSITTLSPDLYDEVFKIYQKYSKNCNSYLTGCNCNCEINNLFNQLKNMI